MTTKEKIIIMQAHLDGKQIQVKKWMYDWEDLEQTDEPIWDWGHSEYRIKQTELTEAIVATKQELNAMSLFGKIVKLKPSPTHQKFVTKISDVSLEQYQPNTFEYFTKNYLFFDANKAVWEEYEDHIKNCY